MFLNRAPRIRTAVACLTTTINGVEDLSWRISEAGVRQKAQVIQVESTNID